MFCLDPIVNFFKRTFTVRMRRRRDGNTPVVPGVPATFLSDSLGVDARDDGAVETPGPRNENAGERVADDADDQDRESETASHPKPPNLNADTADQRDNLAVSASVPAIIQDPVADLNNIATEFYARYERLGEPSNLGAAITNAEAAIKLIPTSNPNRPTIQSNLSAYLGSRYARYGNVTDLDHAIEHAEAAVRATPVSDQSRARRLGNLSNRFDARYQRLGNTDDLSWAIQYAEDAVAASTFQAGDQAYTPTALSILSSCLHARYNCMEDPTDLEAAILNINKGISLLQCEQDDPQYIQFLNNLSIYLMDRFKRLGKLDDLETAIKYSETVLAATPESHPNHPSKRNILSNGFYFRYLALGDVPDLENSLEHAKASVAATPAGHPHLAGRLTVLSNRHRDRFDRIGDLQDLDLAVSFARAAQKATPIDHPQIGQRSRSLSKGLYVRYQRFGRLNDLEAAIHHGEAALESTTETNPDRVYCLEILSACLDARYQRMGASKDLETAIEYSEEVVKATPETSPALAGRLNNLSTALDARYQRSGQRADLHLAIQTAKAALAAAAEGSLVRATILSNLSAILLLEFWSAPAAGGGGLEDAIKYAQGAVDITSDDDPDLGGRLSNLSNLLDLRFQQDGQIVDLEAAIDQGENALVHTPLDHPNLAGRLSNLAYTFVLRYNLSNSPSDGQRAYAMYLGAWKCLESPPLIRIIAAWSAVRYFPSFNSWDKASSMLEDAVRLMPKISLVTRLERNDQQKILGELYGLSADAAAAALEAGKGPAHALGLLELGRGILSGFVMDTRSGDLAELKGTHPELWKQFVDLRIEINAPLKSPENDFSAARRREAMEEFELTLASIRAIPDYREFLLPPAPESLCKAAQSGPIMVINCTSLRSDAIIVTVSSITALNLPRLLYADAKVKMKQLPELLKGSPKTVGSRNKKMNDMFRWLWEVAVEPILETLGLGTPIEIIDQKSTAPRIWWIGVGELSIAPFHAAGNHKPGFTSNALSRVCSSYIPIIKALSYTRQKRFKLFGDANADGRRRILLITMPTTPNHTALLNVEQEAQSIVNTVNKAAQITVLNQPSASEVLQKFPGYDAIHFACHGLSDRKNPSKSSLILVDHSSGIPTADPLTVYEISNRHIEHAQLAYLSACSTADNTATNLGDETIHLASAFQLAGFTHVLANLWKSKDEACMQVAGDFYSALFNGDGEGEGDEQSRVSLALHRAVTRLREKTLKTPIIWAPFIHTGA